MKSRFRLSFVLLLMSLSFSLGCQRANDPRYQVVTEDVLGITPAVEKTGDQQQPAGSVSNTADVNSSDRMEVVNVSEVKEKTTEDSSGTPAQEMPADGNLADVANADTKPEMIEKSSVTQEAEPANVQMKGSEAEVQTTQPEVVQTEPAPSFNMSPEQLMAKLSGGGAEQNAAKPVPLEIKLLVPEKSFVAEGAEKALRVSFDDTDLLKILNMEPVPENAAEYFPQWLKDLDGKRIILRGWMFPPTRPDGISSFMFVRDNGICCFGRDPKVYDKFAVKLRKGVTTKYIQNRPFDVVGTLTIDPLIEGTDEGLWWLYYLDDAIVIDK